MNASDRFSISGMHRFVVLNNFPVYSIPDSTLRFRRLAGATFDGLSLLCFILKTIRVEPTMPIENCFIHSSFALIKFDIMAA